MLLRAGRGVRPPAGGPGSDLVLVARSADRLEALAEDLRTRHRVTVTALPADLSLADEVSRVAAHAAASEVDVLVNNAGFGTYGTFVGLDAGREHAEIMVNAVAAVELSPASGIQPSGRPSPAWSRQPCRTPRHGKCYPASSPPAPPR
jgi:NAD(P)-dependent dehydrogenase (short-subunit alcohol dehydrogenase family)